MTSYGKSAESRRFSLGQISSQFCRRSESIDSNSSITSCKSLGTKSKYCDNNYRLFQTQKPPLMNHSNFKTSFFQPISKLPSKKPELFHIASMDQQRTSQNVYNTEANNKRSRSGSCPMVMLPTKQAQNIKLNLDKVKTPLVIIPSISNTFNDNKNDSKNEISFLLSLPNSDPNLSPSFSVTTNANWVDVGIIDNSNFINSLNGNQKNSCKESYGNIKKVSDLTFKNSGSSRSILQKMPSFDLDDNEEFTFPCKLYYNNNNRQEFHRSKSSVPILQASKSQPSRPTCFEKSLEPLYALNKEVELTFPLNTIKNDNLSFNNEIIILDKNEDNCFKIKDEDVYSSYDDLSDTIDIQKDENRFIFDDKTTNFNHTTNYDTDITQSAKIITSLKHDKVNLILPITPQYIRHDINENLNNYYLTSHTQISDSENCQFSDMGDKEVKGVAGKVGKIAALFEQKSFPPNNSTFRLQRGNLKKTSSEQFLNSGLIGNKLKANQLLKSTSVHNGQSVMAITSLCSPTDLKANDKSSSKYISSVFLNISKQSPTSPFTHHRPPIGRFNSTSTPTEDSPSSPFVFPLEKSSKSASSFTLVSTASKFFPPKCPSPLPTGKTYGTNISFLSSQPESLVGSKTIFDKTKSESPKTQSHNNAAIIEKQKAQYNRLLEESKLSDDLKTKLIKEIDDLTKLKQKNIIQLEPDQHKKTGILRRENWRLQQEIQSMKRYLIHCNSKEF